MKINESEGFNFSIFSGAGFKNLRVLNLSANNIVAITTKFELPGLELINISKNSLRSLAFLSNCRNLREIFAGKNSLKSLTGLLSLKELSLLDLSDNKVENFDDLGILSFNAKLVRLDLRGNPVEFKRGFKGNLKKLFANIREDGLPLEKCSRYLNIGEIAFCSSNGTNFVKKKFCALTLN